MPPGVLTPNININQTNMKIIIPTIIAVVGLAGVPAAFAQSCCAGANGATNAGCSMWPTSLTPGCVVGQAAGKADGKRVAIKVFAKPVQAVYDNYIAVQSALANDSLEGVTAAAAAMSKSVQADPKKTLSPKVAQQAEALAKAKDLAGARDAFKKLSDSLIEHLATQKIAAGIYHVGYCPMAKASWIQTEKTVLNPYMGSSMLHCGQLKT